MSDDAFLKTGQADTTFAKNRRRLCGGYECFGGDIVGRCTDEMVVDPPVLTNRCLRREVGHVKSCGCSFLAGLVMAGLDSRRVHNRPLSIPVLGCRFTQQVGVVTSLAVMPTFLEGVFSYAVDTLSTLMSGGMTTVLAVSWWCQVAGCDVVRGTRCETFTMLMTNAGVGVRTINRLDGGRFARSHLSFFPPRSCPLRRKAHSPFSTCVRARG